MKQIKIFEYLPELDAFKLTEEYREIAKELGLEEWNPVVWLGRYFTLDNDYGEHWFDNHELREKISEKSSEYGYSAQELYIIDPERFQNGKDGPCHSSELRKEFWREVLKSLKLSPNFLFKEARHLNTKREELPEEGIKDLEERIARIKEKYSE